GAMWVVALRAGDAALEERVARRLVELSLLLRVTRKTEGVDLLLIGHIAPVHEHVTGAPVQARRRVGGGGLRRVGVRRRGRLGGRGRVGEEVGWRGSRPRPAPRRSERPA